MEDKEKENNEELQLDTETPKIQGEKISDEETAENVRSSKEELQEIGEPKSTDERKTGEESSEEETPEDVRSSKEELREIREPKSVGSDEPKKSETTISQEEEENERIVKRPEKYEKPTNYSDDPEVQRILNFLRNKNLSENLIGRILKNGICGGFDRLLRALGVTDEEISIFKWKKRFDSNDFSYHSIEPEIMDFGESSMSPDNLYLKKHFGDTLVRAMKDIVKFKPRDPVDFLANWLIHYKVCEERTNKFNEFQAELNAQRESSKIPEMDLQSEFVSDDGKEKSIDNDVDYGEYDERE